MKTIARAVVVVALVLAAGLALPGLAAAQGNFHTIPPCRIFDSRQPADAPALAHNTPRLIQITGPECGVDGNSSAVAVNLTVTQGTSGGDVVLYAGDAPAPAPPRPGALPFSAGQTRAKVDIVALASDGDGDINALATLDGGAGHSVHVIIDVNGYFVDDLAPVAVDDTATVTEDDPATTIDVLANDTDADGGTMVINAVQNPSDQGGTVLITNAGADLTYEPAADYCNNPPGTTPDTFTYTLNGGSTATVSVTVDCVEDDPTAVDDTATVAEDSGANTINVLANDTDPDGGAKTITAVQNPSAQGGTVLITNAGADLTYEPAAGYCNDPPGTTLDTFTYTISPGGDTATVTVTVTCDDDAGTAVDDVATVVEDSGANTIDVLANDTDPDGGSTITAVQNPSAQGGTVLITNAGADLTYQPAANYCNNPPGTTLDTFTYTITGGSTATVTVTVTCVDDAPVAVDDAATVGEDSGANTIDVRANDTDIDAGPMTVDSVQNPSAQGGTVLITNAGADLTYEPAADYCNNPPGTTLDTFTYTLNGGSTATVTVTVNCADDPPAVDLDADDDKGTGGSDFAVTFTEGDAAKLLEDPADATITDSDSTTLASLTVTLTNLLDAGDEVLDADVSAYPNITKTYDDTTNPAEGVLTLSTVSPQPIADFQAVLRTVTYVNTDEDPDATPRVVEFVANDGTSDGNTAISTVTVVPVDDPPVAVDDTATVAEDSGATTINVQANDTDADDASANAITAVQSPSAQGGTVLITNAGADLTYQPAAEYCNDPPGTTLDTFTYTLTPGGDTATVTVTVTCVDDDPTAVDDAATVNEDSGANAIDVLANDTDPDGGTKLVTAAGPTSANGGAIVITGGGTGLTYEPAANYCNNPPGTTLDTFSYTITGGDTATVTVTVTCIEDDPTAVDDAATVVEDSGANAIDVLANDTDPDGGTKLVTAAGPTSANGGAIVITGGGTGLTYAPAANYCNNPPGTTLDTFTYTVTGGDTATVTVTVTCVDDPPVAVDDAATVDEDSGANAIDVLANDTDVDGGPKLVTAAGPTSANGGSVVITGGGTGLTYAPAANYCNNPPGSSLDTFSYTITGGDTATVTVTVTCVNDAPTVVNESFQVIGNTELRVDMTAGTTPHASETTAGASSYEGVLDNDGDPEGDTVSVTGILGCVVADPTAPFDCTLADGAVVHVDANGEFSYTPGAGDASGSFQYTVTDQPSFGTPIGVNGTASFTSFERVWYVDNSQGVDGTGTSISPFNAIDADINTAGGADLDAPGDYIFVDFGNGTNSGQSAGIALENNQHLLGEFAGLSIPVDLNANGSPTVLKAVPGLTDCSGGPCRPVIGNAAGNAVSATDVIPIEIVGLSLSGSVNAIDWATAAAFAGTGTLTIRDNVVTSAGAEGVDILLAGTGATNLAFHDNNLTATGTALDVAETGTGSLTITAFHDNVVTGASAGAGINIVTARFDATPGGGVDPVPGGTTVIGEAGNRIGGAGLTLTAVTGALNFANLASGTIGAGDLDIFTDSGAALSIGGGVGGFDFDVTANAGVLVSNAGPAAVISGADVGLQLSSLTSTNSASTGVSLTTVTGTFSAPSGSSITNAGTTDFEISGGSATVTYGGTITDDVGQLVSVASTTGGTKSFTGAITDGNDGDGSGISLSSNTGATIEFTGGVTLSTGGNPAFAATGGGTLKATGTNTLVTTTATALNISNTTIHTDDVTFRSISVDGNDSSPTNGVVLLNTGSSGGLIVTGTGSSGTGGTIQDTSGDGISLNNTRDVSLSWMSITSNLGSGIFGDDVTNFSLISSSVTNNADTATGAEAGLRFNELLGTSAITNSTVSGSSEDNVRITPASGVLTNLSVTGSTLGPNSVATGGHGISWIASGTAQGTLTISNTNFPTIRGSGVLVNGQDTTSATLNVSGSTFTDNGAAITMQPSEDADLTFSITNNTQIVRSISNAIQLVAGSVSSNASEIRGTISGNTIGNGTVDSGSRDMFGIAIDLRGRQDTEMVISNNSVRNTDFEGIWVSSAYFCTSGCPAGVPGRLDLTLRDNSVQNIDDNSVAPIGFIRGTLVDGRHETTVCLDIAGNTSAGVGGAEHFRVRQRDTSTFLMERLTDGDGTPNEVINNVATVEAHVASQNDAGSTADATLAIGFTEAANGACEDP